MRKSVWPREEGRDPKPQVSPELQKLYDALALDAQLAPDPQREAQAIVWTKVHRLPDFAYFDHRPHVAAGIDCQRCHGGDRDHGPRAPRSKASAWAGAWVVIEKPARRNWRATLWLPLSTVSRVISEVTGNKR